MKTGEILFILFELTPMSSTGQEEGPVLGSGINDLQFSSHPPGDDQAFVRFLFSATADLLAASSFERDDRSFHKGIGGEKGFELSAMLPVEFFKDLVITMNGLAFHSDICICVLYQNVKTPFWCPEEPPPGSRKNLPGPPVENGSPDQTLFGEMCPAPDGFTIFSPLTLGCFCQEPFEETPLRDQRVQPVARQLEDRPGPARRASHPTLPLTD